jgi:hypothetical protein
MSVRPKLALALVGLALALLPLAGCSSSQPRDLNFGTDVGVGYVPPDVAPSIQDAGAVEVASVDLAGVDTVGVDAAGNDTAVADAPMNAVSDAMGVEAGTAVDAAPAQVDTSVDEGASMVDGAPVDGAN